MSWLLLLLAVVCEVSASLSLKGALDDPRLYAVVAAGYGAAFAILAVVLRRGLGLGVAYGVWAALGVAGTALLSTWLFGERFTALMALGIVLVMAGVLLVEIGSQRAHVRQSAVRGSES